MLLRNLLLFSFCLFDQPRRNLAGFSDPFCSFGGWLCCRRPFLTDPDTAYEELTETLMDNVFGQHIAVEVILSTIRAHTSETTPKKALALSFHGYTGVGKSFIADQIVASFYSKGTAKNFVKKYFGPADFPEDTRQHVIVGYKKRLREDIKATVASCERSIFIFDEAHKIPKTVLDTLVPFLEPIGKDFGGINYRRAIFIFISNVGGETINDITLNHYRAKKKRSSLTFHDFEEELKIEAYTSDEQAPGFLESRLLEKALIDLFIPFLPLERQHVKLCADVEIQRVGAAVSAQFIVDKLSFWPKLEGIYSRDGCKNIDGLVKAYHTQKTEL